MPLPAVLMRMPMAKTRFGPASGICREIQDKESPSVAGRVGR